MKHPVTVISQGDRTLRLVSALLMYDSAQGDVYATTHEIQIDASQPERRVIGPGAALTKQSLSKFAAAVGVATAYAGHVPANLLYTSPNLLAWWVPAAIRNTWFKAEDAEIGTASGPAAHPALVFVATPADWFVFALRESKRPTPRTPLCHAPHFNVWDGGQICTGNVSLPGALSAEALAQYEAAFFRSHFTHPNREGAVKYQGGMKALWRDQLAGPDQDAMTLALKPAKENLEAAIKRISTSAANS
ncbi:MAG: PRTRC system protein B [Telluria sp.]